MNHVHWNPRALKIHRIAVSGFFLINGFVLANWASRLPELQGLLNISNSALGTLLFIMAVGAMMAMPFTAWLANRFGSSRVTRFTGILLCIAALCLAFAQNFILAGIVFFILGVANGAMDVAMNEQAVLVEREYQKPIMSSFHAFWSAGMALGAGSGALFSMLEIPLTVHMASIACLGALVLVWAAQYSIISKLSEAKAWGPIFVLPTKAVAALGAIAFCGMLAEGSMIDWSAIYMTKVAQQTQSMGAIAFGSFSVAMMIARIFGGFLTQRLGNKKLLIADGLIAITGLSVVLVEINPWITLAGFFMAGLGLATVVPIVYSSAGNTPGLSPSAGIAMATTIGYAGFFVGPPSIGYLADAYGLKIALVFSLVILVLMLVLILRRNFEEAHSPR